MFEEIVGQNSAKEYLQRALVDNKLANTLLFAGPEGAGKKKTANALASILQNNRTTDLHRLIPEGKSGLHSIESIRKAIDISHEAPFESPVKVFIIEMADRMQPAAANALLKTLEEPVLDSYWILLSSSPREILPTILSRCVKIHFHPVATQHSHPPELTKATGLLAEILSNKPIYPQLFSYLEEIEDLIENEDPLIYQGHVSHLFTSIALYFRDRALKSEEDWLEPLTKARLAFDRNLKLSTCLETFFLYRT